MKKYISICCFFLSAIILSSCENALEEKPITAFSEEQLFSTEQGLETVVNGMYQSFADPAYHGSSYHGLLAPFSGKFWSNQGASQDATSLNCSPINTWLNRLWPQTFETINVANIIINNLENTDVVLANKETALGQAYFIRAATYFDLVRLFGGVPIKTSPSTFETLHTKRSTKQEVYDLIIQDLEKAKLMLPDFNEYLVDRPVKFAANAYLAKVYMTLAGENNDMAMWQAAYDEAIQVYGKYSLVPTYAELFKLGNENTSEAIFELQYGQNGAVRNSDVIRFYTLKNFSDVTTFGRIRPNKETFDQHVNQYPGDPRIDETFIYDSYTKVNGATQTIYPTRANGNDGYAGIRKYLDAGFNGTTTSRNFMKMRYADVLLMLAEIENEINGPANAYQYVNEVLARARNTENGTTTEPADFSGLTQDEFRSRILRERQYEMLAEGHEFYDTRRRGYKYFLEEVVTIHNNYPTFDPRKDFVYPISIKNMLLPIPSIEFSGNRAISVADQNPGY
ncbi:RagB/SusD family nutrient uptake outer membrane protein [Polaribacter aestuariivivens]|uniref:RagB/SusD family nutrient uptake outer membrane protein n=1 Tax=Polaribacter aestuariivivens TaxID=2304626 RepID=A0A5S3N1I5_9FLAO|nr:RagB/SusD family nutrient uptake outer membrane protein [Polaribacter aestuariivivens]TMM29070.1 RagB/SusD family nutrient uptake outer membrane protein [Polaribacter aestuariivivens]